MLLRVRTPAPPVGRFVESITYYEGFDPDHTKERLLPDGAVEIVVDLTETPKRLYDRDDLTRARAFRRAWISGMRRRWIVIEAAPGSSMAVIRFRPGGAYPVLRFSVEGLTDVVDPLDDVLARATASLRDRILEARGAEARIAAAEAWVRERLENRLDHHPVIEFLAGRLFAPAGIRIADVVADIGYSQRHVSDLFRRWVGLTPKQYGRVRRFQQMLTAVTRATPPASEDAGATSFYTRPGGLAEPDWADLAVTHGYYDQSHLARDFRDFAGLTPRQYLHAYRGSENYLPID